MLLFSLKPVLYRACNGQNFSISILLREKGWEIQAYLEALEEKKIEMR